MIIFKPDILESYYKKNTIMFLFIVECQQIKEFKVVSTNQLKFPIVIVIMVTEELRHTALGQVKSSLSNRVDKGDELWVLGRDI